MQWDTLYNILRHDENKTPWTNPVEMFNVYYLKQGTIIYFLI